MTPDLEIEEVRKYALSQIDLIVAGLAAMNDLILAYDRDHRFIFANPTALDAFGFSLKEMVGKHWTELGLPSRPMQEMEQHITGIFERGQPVRAQTEFRHKDGSVHYYDFQMSPIFANAEGRVEAVISVSRDITDRIRAEQRLTEALKSRDQAIRVRDEVLALVSHDLRNPLGAISLSANLILKRFSPARDAEVFRKTVEIIQRAVAQMNRLVQDILVITKIEAGHLTLERQPARADSMIADAIKLLEPLAAEKNIEIHVKDECAEVWVLADQDRIGQVFSNLVGNALKFTPEGGAITLSCKSRDTEVEYAVADTGVGIGEEHMAHLFDRFWQARHSNRAGTGLGLAIAKGIIEAHGGRIWAESRPGAGSVFHFTLPKERRKAGSPPETG